MNGKPTENALSIKKLINAIHTGITILNKIVINGINIYIKIGWQSKQ